MGDSTGAIRAAYPAASRKGAAGIDSMKTEPVSGPARNALSPATGDCLAAPRRASTSSNPILSSRV